MSELHEAAVSLRFFGDDLDPDEITSRLGAEPTVGVRKGGLWKTGKGIEKIARRGSWRLEAGRSRPGNLDDQIAELLNKLSGDLKVWQDLTERFRADLFCGLFLNEGNEGLGLSPATLVAVGTRGLLLNLDIYGSELG